MGEAKQRLHFLTTSTLQHPGAQVGWGGWHRKLRRPTSQQASQPAACPLRVPEPSDVTGNPGRPLAVYLQSRWWLLQVCVGKAGLGQEGLGLGAGPPFRWSKRREADATMSPSC